MRHHRALRRLGNRLEHAAAVIRDRARESAQPAGAHPRNEAAPAIANDPDFTRAAQRVPGRSNVLQRGIGRCLRLERPPARDVLGRVTDVDVGLVAIEQCRRDHCISVLCESVADTFNVAVDAENFLRHHHRSPRIASRVGSICRQPESVDRSERYQFAHKVSLHGRWNLAGIMTFPSQRSPCIRCHCRPRQRNAWDNARPSDASDDQETKAMKVDRSKIEPLIRQLLIEIGEDPQREGLLQTPKRVAEALEYLTSGNRVDLQRLINGAVFTQETNSMVIVKNIEVYSLCEHHMLPFFGRCHIGYIPSGRVFGVSKLARMVDMYARRLQLQERLTEQISKEVMESVDAKGVGVMIEARHLCMMMRGVEKQNSVMITSSVLGTFRESTATREEFLALIGNRPT